MLKKYGKEVESSMKTHYKSLLEKGQRHYAAVEAIKLGWGGQTYISKLFGITRNKVLAGIYELQDKKLLDQIPEGKERRPGGGRKKKKK